MLGLKTRSSEIEHQARLGQLWHFLAAGGGQPPTSSSPGATSGCTGVQKCKHDSREQATQHQAVESGQKHVREQLSASSPFWPFYRLMASSRAAQSGLAKLYKHVRTLRHPVADHVAFLSSSAAGQTRSPPSGADASPCCSWLFPCSRVVQ